MSLTIHHPDFTFTGSHSGLTFADGFAEIPGLDDDARGPLLANGFTISGENDDPEAEAREAAAREEAALQAEADRLEAERRAQDEEDARRRLAEQAAAERAEAERVAAEEAAAAERDSHRVSPKTEGTDAQSHHPAGDITEVEAPTKQWSVDRIDDFAATWSIDLTGASTKPGKVDVIEKAIADRTAAAVADDGQK